MQAVNFATVGDRPPQVSASILIDLEQYSSLRDALQVSNYALVFEAILDARRDVWRELLINKSNIQAQGIILFYQTIITNL